MGLTEWTLVSRTRYALVWGPINVLVVFGLMLLSGYVSLQRLLLFGVPIALLSCLAQAFIWYPRAKRKLTAETG
jgi:hypothetical protein